jgi:two-component system, LytTR family, response regulator
MNTAVSNPLTTFIAEDEPLAAEALKEWVQARNDLMLVGEASNGVAAIQEIIRLRPSLILMDINMPGKTGLQVAKEVMQQKGQGWQPAIVFTTAYDEHALTAFELHAIDYLLKPYSQERFNEAIDHAQSRQNDIASREADEALQALDGLEGQGFAEKPEPLNRIMVRDQGKIFPLRMDQVEYLKSDTKYTALAYQGRSFLVRLALGAFEGRLDPERFIKLQRSCIVNLDYVESMTPDEMSQLVVKMRDGSQFTASREVSKQLRNQSL